MNSRRCPVFLGRRRDVFCWRATKEGQSVAFAGHGDDVVELKRMYVNPDQRGKGVGLKLVNELIAYARKLKAKSIVLDSYHTMYSAHRIYRAVGFKEVAAPADFPENLASRVVFMEMGLA